MTGDKDYEARTREILQQHFTRMWKAESWARSADTLRQAASLLFSAYDSSTTETGEPISPEDLDMDRPGTLLFGYAVENAIKGLLIKRHNLNSTSFKSMKGWHGHDLVALFNQTGIPQDKELELLLRILTAHIVWAGKYPCAFDFEGPKGFILYEQFDHAPWNIAKNMPPRTLDHYMRERLDDLFKQLQKEVQGERRPRRAPKA